jgi:hypothetical protein
MKFSVCLRAELNRRGPITESEEKQHDSNKDNSKNDNNVMHFIEMNREIAQDRVKWPTFVNSLMNLRAHIKVVQFLEVQ